jgi:hypothetical protein
MFMEPNYNNGITDEMISKNKTANDQQLQFNAFVDRIEDDVKNCVNNLALIVKNFNDIRYFCNVRNSKKETALPPDVAFPKNLSDRISNLYRNYYDAITSSNSSVNQFFEDLCHLINDLDAYFTILQDPNCALGKNKIYFIKANHLLFSEKHIKVKDRYMRNIPNISMNDLFSGILCSLVDVKDAIEKTLNPEMPPYLATSLSVSGASAIMNTLGATLSGLLFGPAAFLKWAFEAAILGNPTVKNAASNLMEQLKGQEKSIQSYKINKINDVFHTLSGILSNTDQTIDKATANATKAVFDYNSMITHDFMAKALVKQPNSFTSVSEVGDANTINLLKEETSNNVNYSEIINKIKKSHLQGSHLQGSYLPPEYIPPLKKKKSEELKNSRDRDALYNNIRQQMESRNRETIAQKPENPKILDQEKTDDQKPTFTQGISQREINTFEPEPHFHKYNEKSVIPEYGTEDTSGISEVQVNNLPEPNSPNEKTYNQAELQSAKGSENVTTTSSDGKIVTIKQYTKEQNGTKKLEYSILYKVFKKANVIITKYNPQGNMIFQYTGPVAENLKADLSTNIDLIMKEIDKKPGSCYYQYCHNGKVLRLMERYLKEGEVRRTEYDENGKDAIKVTRYKYDPKSKVLRLMERYLKEGDSKTIKNNKKVEVPKVIKKANNQTTEPISRTQNSDKKQPQRTPYNNLNKIPSDLYTQKNISPQTRTFMKGLAERTAAKAPFLGPDWRR